MLTVSSFVAPLVDVATGQLRERQPLKPGMLCQMSRSRVAISPADSPKGEYYVQLVRKHPQTGYWVIKMIARPGYRSCINVGGEYVTGVRTLNLLHPNPEFYGESTLNRRYLTTMYSTYNEGIKAAHRQRAIARWKELYAEGREYRYQNEVIAYENRRGYTGESGVRYRREAKINLRNRIQRNGKLGTRAAKYIAKNSVEGLNRLQELINNNNTSSRLLDAFDAYAARLNVMRRDGCGHWDAADRTPMRIVGHYGPQYRCAACEAQMQEDAGRLRNDVLNGDGSPVDGWVDSHACSVYQWSDGTHRLRSEPPLVGGYHSSKQFFTRPFANPDGSKHTGLCAGVELEFVWASTAQRNENTVVGSMYADLEAALPKHGRKGGYNRYCAFERDGSVDFEMVTGFGPLATHRAAILAMFGKNQYGRDLRSHDGGRCGIHVHLDKPKSLMHAMKLTRFWHANENRDLIKAVARRYDAGGRYAKVVPEKAKAAAELKRAFKHAKDNVGYYGTTDGMSKRQSIMRQAIDRINSDRYELLNFHNPKTVEVRAFRGTLRVETILACLEFAVMTWYFARDTPAHKLTTDEFCKFVSLEENRAETRFLRSYLNGKGFDVWVPKAVPVKTTVQLEDVAHLDVNAPVAVPVVGNENVEDADPSIPLAQVVSEYHAARQQLQQLQQERNRQLRNIMRNVTLTTTGA